MKQIICLSNEPWSKLPCRTQQLMSRMRDVQILYFFRSQRQIWPLVQKSGTKVRPNLTVYALPHFPPPWTGPHGILFGHQQRHTAAWIASRVARHRFKDPLLWTTSPEQLHLLDRLNYDGLVYDCDREWNQFPPQWEGQLAHTADVVFAASPVLADRLSPCSSNIVLSPNGVNFSLFAQEFERPDPLPHVQGPLIGWAGTIWFDLDLSPILYAAQVRPDWNFLLLGRRERENPFLSQLCRLPNVMIPGSCPIHEVPNWLYRCDVLVDLFRADDPYSDIISPRLYEYLATGKPIVSMLWPDQVEQFPDVVYAACHPDEFVTLCSHAMEESPKFVSRRRRSHAANASWSLRTKNMVQILTTAGLL